MHANFDENYGYVDDRLVLVDVGDIRLGRQAIRHDVERRIFLQRPASTKLEQRHPALARHVFEVIEKKLSIVPDITFLGA